MILHICISTVCWVSPAIYSSDAFADVLWFARYWHGMALWYTSLETGIP